jgi:hypothetical protein
VSSLGIDGDISSLRYLFPNESTFRDTHTNSCILIKPVLDKFFGGKRADPGTETSQPSQQWQLSNIILGAAHRNFRKVNYFIAMSYALRSEQAPVTVRESPVKVALFPVTYQNVGYKL